MIYRILQNYVLYRNVCRLDIQLYCYARACSKYLQYIQITTVVGCASFLVLPFSNAQIILVFKQSPHMCALQLYCRLCVVHGSLSINCKHFRKFHSLKFGCHLKNKFTRVFLNLILLTLLPYICTCGRTAAVCGISLFLCIPLLMIVILIHSDRFNYNKN